MYINIIEKETQVANTDTKRCLTPLVLGEIQIKILRMSDDIKYRQEWGWGIGTSCTVDGIVNRCC